MWLKDSSIGRKFIMSISGLFLVLFLLFHGSMNLCLVIDDLCGTQAYNWICVMLGANWYALAGTLVLALGVLVHFCYAFILTIQNRAARGNDRYAVEARQEGVDWASKNMLALGIIVCDDAACDELKVGTYKYFLDIEKKNLNPDTLFEA